MSKALPQQNDSTLRSWTLEVCQGCDRPHGPRDRWTACPAEGFSHSAGGDLHDTERVEVIEAEPILWARDRLKASADRWRRAYDEMWTVMEQIAGSPLPKILSEVSGNGLPDWLTLDEIRAAWAAYDAARRAMEGSCV